MKNYFKKTTLLMFSIPGAFLVKGIIWFIIGWISMDFADAFFINGNLFYIPIYFYLIHFVIKKSFLLKLLQFNLDYQSNITFIEKIKFELLFLIDCIFAPLHFGRLIFTHPDNNARVLCETYTNIKINPIKQKDTTNSGNT